MCYRKGTGDVTANRLAVALLLLCCIAVVCAAAGCSAKPKAVARSTRTDKLFAGVRRGDERAVKALLVTGADANARDKSGNTPLHIAAERGYLRVMRTLIRRGAKVNARNSSGDTPLSVVMPYDETSDAAVMLISLGADVNARNSYRYTPLYWAVRRGDSPLVKLMLSEGGRMDLFVAAGTGDLKRVTDLIGGGARVNVADGQGYTPLHWAAEGARYEVVARLISSGADVNARNKVGLTPLYFAVGGFYSRRNQKRLDQSDIVRTVRVLVSNGADVNAKSREGETPLQLAELRGRKAVVEILRRHGARE